MPREIRGSPRRYASRLPYLPGPRAPASTSRQPCRLSHLFKVALVLGVELRTTSAWPGIVGIGRGRSGSGTLGSRCDDQWHDLSPPTSPTRLTSYAMRKARDLIVGRTRVPSLVDHSARPHRGAFYLYVCLIAQNGSNCRCNLRLGPPDQDNCCIARCPDWVKLLSVMSCYNMKATVITATEGLRSTARPHTHQSLRSIPLPFENLPARLGGS